MFYYKRTVIRFRPNREPDVLTSVHEYDDGLLDSAGFYAAINRWNRETSLQVKNGISVGQNVYSYCWITRDEYLNHK